MMRRITDKRKNNVPADTPGQGEGSLFVEEPVALINQCG